MRNTKQKDFVFNNLKLRYDHPTAYQIVSDAKLKNIEIGITSVYRILNDLIKKGLVCKIITKDNIAHYDFVRNNHVHLVCNNCGKIVDVNNEEVFSDKFNCNFHGFNLNTQDITFFGKCENCKTVTNNKYTNKSSK